MKVKNVIELFYRLLKMDFGKLAASRDAVMAEWQRRYGTKVPPRS